MRNLLSAESHFEFGENWTDFLSVVSEEHKANAVSGMQKLFPNGELQSASFLDIGCGSGLHSLAAARLGAASIYSTDIDRNSVSATRRALGEVEGKTSWKAETISVFDLPPGQFDVVYSWGVLHHTGDMWGAIHAASKQVKPGGLFAIAIYAKTPLCWAWRIEKLLYARSPDWLRAPWRWTFSAFSLLAMWAAGGARPSVRLREKRERGMTFTHDLHDWLGGYPYESATSSEVSEFVTRKGFTVERTFPKRPTHGLLGSGCSEYVFRRI